ncbi:AAA family ATPase [Candidatus Woesearchaeota archaeon]|jgi:proteasome regulatory subunit|nr:AAA family ATPase [Candidatus Woesearchaeota archaeon]MBT4111112.1 AAA family ATPase [Candidatus Woesearchaeota archaeon]MBT4335756.1 AAA family ATPase [Candidatus Woesearchaeota archaeon]MBT4469279.1 AAA family ATPase [Candidatus Woesearchaeota archaeon]MBT6744251.1 AAA family ATPase [Candidatus Woesearchaeota archaeon]
MANEDTKKKVVYSETIELDDLETENKALLETVDQLEEEKKLSDVHVRRMEEETVMLKELFNKTSSELSNLKKPSLLVADVITTDKDHKAVIKLPNGNKFYCNISNEISELFPGDSVLVEQKALNIVKRIDLGENQEVEKFVIMEKPKENWKDIGGLKEEIEEIKEVIELPLKKPELFKKVGIKPPKGVLLYGPPGTGKTLLAKAVAQSTNATFIEVVGSELVQKFIGEGAKLIKEIFNLARRKAPSIVFIDEIDALAAKRMETGTSGEREVNRTFMQLLAELDGFKCLDEVKIIGATNRIDILDHAMIRPGRLDRLIEVSLPDASGRLEVLKVHTKEMNLQKVKLKELSELMENFSGAEVRAVCTEAGYFAIRNDRDHVGQDDFLMAIDKVRMEEEEEDNGGFFG